MNPVHECSLSCLRPSFLISYRCCCLLMPPFAEKREHFTLRVHVMKRVPVFFQEGRAMTQQHVTLNEQGCTNCILIVEDDTAIGELLTLALAYETPYQPRLVSSGQEALRTVQEVHPILLLLNYQLPD